MFNNLVESIESDQNIKLIISEIINSSAYDLGDEIGKLDLLLLSKLCEKSYLEKCEPFYCTYRYTSNCRYLLALNYIAEKYKIDIVNKRINT